MLLNSLTILCVFALANAATIKQSNIPVEVRYDDKKESSNESVNSVVKSVDGKVEEAVKEAITQGQLAVKNASQEINADAISENIIVPEKESAQPATTILGDNKENSEITVSEYVQRRLSENLGEKTQLSSEEKIQALKHLPVKANISENSVIKELETPSEQATTAEPATSDLNIFQEVKQFLSNSLKNLRESFKAGDGQSQPSLDQWNNLEEAVNSLLEEEKNKLNVKQSPPASNQNFFQNIASGFQNVANNFIQGIQGGSNNNNGSQGQGDEGTAGGSNQGGFQGFVSYFQGGVNNIVNSISSIGQRPTTSNTVLGDSGTGTTQSPNLISSFVNNVQQFFGGIQGGSQTGGPAGSQGDTGSNGSSTTAQVGGPVQVIQQIGSAIGNFIQGNRPAGAAGDTGTTSPQSGNLIQNIGQNVGSAFQLLNPFKPNQNGGSAPTLPSGGQGPQTAIVQGAQQIGNQIQELIPGQSSTEVTKAGTESTVQAAKKEETTPSQADA